MADAIRLEQVVKQYRLGAERTNLRAANPWSKNDVFNGATTLAIDGVDLTVSEGEALGLTGDNGAGKSTLLKLIAGVVAPTSGRVLTRGRIASVIELGVGFHSDLTGFENLEFSAALLGMPPAEMRRRRDAIIEFSGIGYAMGTPVKRYSSGMVARLGFALATHVDADILLLDEVLAVGDIGFQRLSLERLEQLVASGVTTVFVSHNLAAIAHLCTRVHRLTHGQLSDGADPETAVRDYAGPMALTRAGLGVAPVRLSSLRVLPERVAPNQPFEIEARIDVERPMPKGRLQLVLRPSAALLALWASPEALDAIGSPDLVVVQVPADVVREPGSWVLRGSVAGFPMFSGAYTFTLELREGERNDLVDAAAASIEVPGAENEIVPLTLPVSWARHRSEPN
jgi:ABC-type polysaccharide/polyol phosphate transport system ATPase subunit